jgi:hypothetical protein
MLATFTTQLIHLVLIILIILGEECKLWGRRERCLKILSGNPNGGGHLGGTVNMEGQYWNEYKEVACKGLSWIHLTWDMNCCDFVFHKRRLVSSGSQKYLCISYYRHISSQLQSLRPIYPYM